MAEVAAVFSRRVRVRRLFVDEITAVRDWQRALKRAIEFLYAVPQRPGRIHHVVLPMIVRRVAMRYSFVLLLSIASIGQGIARESPEVPHGPAASPELPVRG